MKLFYFLDKLSQVYPALILSQYSDLFLLPLFCMTATISPQVKQKKESVQAFIEFQNRTEKREKCRVSL